MMGGEESTTAQQANEKGTYRDSGLPIEARIQNLLGRMTLEEKVRQMDMCAGCASFAAETFPGQDTAMARDAQLSMEAVERVLGTAGIGCIHDLHPPDASAINALQRYAVERTRLGIPILFTEEGLHGLCGPGNTIFPQAIGLSGTWNPTLVRRVGAAIASETRAYGIHELLGPVLDISRDPRWGRMEETYGEDTYLASRMAVAMTKGLQGNNLTADDAIIAEPKHFAGYGMTRGGLNCASTHMGTRELRAYYLPVFEAAVREGGAMGIMCAYNSIDGIPCAASRWLLTTVLREEWGFRGFVRSDLGAVARLELEHGTASGPDEAVRQAVEAGLDAQFYDYEPQVFQGALIRMVEEGRMAEATLDRAVARVLRAKFMLGLFENPYVDEGLVKARVRCADHLDLTLECARESICLMKNDGALLPLPRDLKHIAVIGPSAHAARMGDYTAAVHGFEPVTVLDGIRALASSDTIIEHVVGVPVVSEQLEAVPAAYLVQPDGAVPGLRGEYFANDRLEGEPVAVRIDETVDFNWIYTKPVEGVGTTGFSIRWTGALVPDRGFEGRLGTSSQDSMRMWVDDELLVDGWEQGTSRNTNLSAPFSFEAGRAYRLRIEFKKDASAVQVMLGWNEGEAGIADAVEAAARADIAILCMGDSRDTCGESRERSMLDLPGRQGELVRAVYATGTPVVLLLQIGRALTLPWETEHIPAIVNAWFPGERGGQAIAEVLFGLQNPAGRLPVSFPKSVGQLPVYYAAPPFGPQQYIDLDREPFFPFGHGLSYTSFTYSDLTVTPRQTGPGGRVEVSVAIENTGDRPGDEVVQLYLNDVVSSVVRPLKELCGFERIHLAPGEKRFVHFSVGPEHLRLLNPRMEWAVEPGRFELMAGGSSETVLKTDFEIVAV